MILDNSCGACALCCVNISSSLLWVVLSPQYNVQPCPHLTVYIAQLSRYFLQIFPQTSSQFIYNSKYKHLDPPDSFISSKYKITSKYIFLISPVTN